MADPATARATASSGRWAHADTTTSPPAPTDDPNAEPSLLDEDEAAEQYLDSVTPYNEALAELSRTVQRTPLAFEAWLEPASALAEANRQLTVDLTTIPWPTSIAEDAEDLAAATANSQAMLRNLAGAETLDDAELAWSDFLDSREAGQGPSELIRVKLGLPEAEPADDQPSNWA